MIDVSGGGPTHLLVSYIANGFYGLKGKFRPHALQNKYYNVVIFIPLVTLSKYKSCTDFKRTTGFMQLRPRRFACLQFKAVEPIRLL